ncbi:MAG: YXWGXW repeat-containing protein [Terracidiphilus sp.]
MRSFRWMRVILLALMVCLIPAISSAAVFISVGFAPPVLPVYVQPPCPEPGWMWTPGYWAYGDDGYYWVPGTWVPAPYVGALWTPGYWGWGGGLYVWHRGYWGLHVGYYGGVNYGFGYMGIGFVGGMWAGGAFRYNTAVMNVNRTVIHNTYDDRAAISSHTVARDSHVAYSGGPGGINHPSTAQETTYSHEQHIAPTSYQTHQEAAAKANVNSYASHNGGHPANVATARPMAGPRNAGGGTPNGAHAPAASTNHGAGPGSSHANGEGRPTTQSHESHSAPSHGGGQPHGQPHSGGHEKGH